jgi:hypothetical protein
MVRSCSSSGQTVTEWCSENGIGKNTYYHRQKQVREAALSEFSLATFNDFEETNRSNFVELPMLTDSSESSTGSPALTIRFKGRACDIYNGADANVIQNTIAVVCEL